MADAAPEILQLPRTLFGAGALSALPDELARLGVDRPLFVTDQGLVKSGIAARALALVPGGRSLFDAVTPNPLFADADAAAALFTDEGCDGVVAIGGGSVIDVAKFVALLAGNPGRTADYAGHPDATQRAGAPLVAIPTTAGTGSEASPDAGIHPDATTPSTGINSPFAIPSVAILDPALTISLPPRLTAATGIDAMSHCIEGYLSRRGSPVGKAMALHGLSQATTAIRRAVSQGDDIEARAAMMSAAYCGGAAIAMGLGPAHAFAITCSDQGFAHGILSGIGLVATLDLVAPRVPAAISAIRTALGLSAEASLTDALASMMAELGLPSNLGELGYRADDVAALGRAAHASFFNLSAPYHPSAADYTGAIAASLSGHRSSG